jgi:hypothetical protein
LGCDLLHLCCLVYRTCNEKNFLLHLTADG